MHQPGIDQSLKKTIVASLAPSTHSDVEQAQNKKKSERGRASVRGIVNQKESSGSGNGSIRLGIRAVERDSQNSGNSPLGIEAKELSDENSQRQPIKSGGLRKQSSRICE